MAQRPCWLQAEGLGPPGWESRAGQRGRELSPALLSVLLNRRKVGETAQPEAFSSPVTSSCKEGHIRARRSVPEPDTTLARAGCSVETRQLVEN